MAIARAIPLAPATVRRYASRDRPPERGERRIGPSQLDPWLAYLEHRRAEGCEIGLQLLRELRDRGYAGGSRQVHKWLQSRRTKVAITTPRRWRDAIPVVTGPGSAELPARRVQLPGSKVLAWIMTVAPDRLSPADSALLAHHVGSRRGHATRAGPALRRARPRGRDEGERILRTWQPTSGGVRGLDRRGEGERHPSRADVRQRARR